MRRLAYRGGAPAIQDLVGGQIPIVVGTLADALPNTRPATFACSATTGEKRSPFMSDVPTRSRAATNLGSRLVRRVDAEGTPSATVDRRQGAG